MRSRPALAILATPFLLAAALAGCGPVSASPAGDSSAPAGSAPASPSAPGSPSGPGSASPRSPASSGSAVSQPAGGPVPGGFAASSVTFVSADEAYVLGTAPCAHAPCTSIVRTTDRGASWAGLPAPVVELGNPHEATGNVVWGIRFASRSQGFVFGSELWETADGGEHWARASGPAGRIVSLEISDGEVLAVTQTCPDGGSCGTSGTLVRRPLAGGAWTTLGPAAAGPIATGSGTAAVLDSSRVLTTSDGGRSLSSHATPCTGPDTSVASSVAVTGPDSLALLCAGGAAMGSVSKTVYASSNLGGSWTKEGSPPAGGDPLGIAGGSASRLVVAADSGASWLYDSGDGGRAWGTAYSSGDGGMGFNDLGFTNASDGVAVRAPATTDDNSPHAPGQLLLTSDGGATWHAVTW